jgi:hypothetical protein
VLRSRLILSDGPMCEQCDKIQEQISHYRRFLNQRFDPLTEQRIAEAIKELQQRKEAMH